MKIFIVVALIGLSATFAAGQEVKPTPNAADSSFSESSPYTPRVIKSRSDKNEKKSKKQATAVPVVSPTPAPVVKNPITIPVSVLDKTGQFIGGLGAADFTVFVDGRSVRIVEVNADDGPINLVLLLDASPSAAIEPKQVISVANAVIDQLRPGDTAMVIQFAGSAKILSQPTTDLVQVKDKLKKLSMGDGTAFYDTIRAVSEQVVSKMPGRTIVVLLTDAVDTTSRTADFQTALAAAERTDTVFYPIYLDTRRTALARRQQSLPDPVIRAIMQQNPRLNSGMADEEYQVGRQFLEDLVSISGGRTQKAESFMKGRPEMNIRDQAARRYLLTFVPDDGLEVGKRINLKVRINRPKVTVHARGSYIIR